MAKSFATSWLRGESEATALLPDAFRSVDARVRIVRDAAQRPLDPKLLSVLRRQNDALPPSPQRQAHLDLLAQPGTTVVVTGQQVGLFLGPLYTLYKASSAIAVARQVQAETGVACVPVFWLQTEDHDFAEIDHCFLPRTGAEPLKIALEPTEASRIPVAHRLLGTDVLGALTQLDDALTGHPDREATVDLLRRHYRPGVAMADAFAGVLAELFADQGLVLFQPRDPEIAVLAAPLHRRLVQEARALSRELDAQVDGLFAAHFAPQVHVRSGSPLSFVSPDAVDGPRYRLDPATQADTWLLVGDPAGRHVTTTQLLDWLETEPLRFTTSALARPLLQDLLLPTVAYVGGPGEVAYFAQLAPAYIHLGVEMPLILHRDRFALLDARMRAFLTDHALTVNDLAQPRDTLLLRLADRTDRPPPQETLRKMMTALDLAGLGREMAALDPTLLKAALRTEDTVQEALAKLLEKHAKALAQRDHALVERLERARLWLMPGGVPQERVYGMPGPAARFGQKRLVDAVLAACQPFAAELHELTF